MEDAKTIRYVSKDPIQNLKIRVTLWRLSVQKSKATLNNPGAVNQTQAAAQAALQSQQAQAMLQQHAMQQQQLLMQQQAGMPFPQPLPAQVFVGPDGRPFLLPPGTAPPPGAVPAPPEMAAAVLAAQPPAAPAGPPGQVFIGPDGRPFLLPPGMALPPGAVPAPPEMAAAILAQQPPAPAPAVPMAADPMAAAAAAQAAAMAAAGQVPAAGTGVGAAQAQYVDPQQQAAMLQQQQQQATVLGQQQQALLQQQQQQAAAAVQAQAQAAQAQAQANEGQQGQAQQGQGQPMPQPLPPQGAAQPQPFQPQPPPPRPAQALGESVDLTRRGGTGGGGSSGGGAPPSRTASIGSVRALGGTAGAAAGSRSGRARMASVPSSSLLELTSAAAAAATTTTGGAAAGAGGAGGQHTGTGVRAAGLTASPAASAAGWGGSVVGLPPASSDPFAMLGPGPDPPRRRFGRAIGEADEDGADGGIPAAGDAAGAPAAATGTAEPAGGARQARRRRAGRLGDDQAGDADTAGGDPNAAAGAGADPAQAAAAQAAAAAAAAAAPPGLGILPQEVAKVVPYGTLGAEARMAATGEPPEVPPTTPVHLLPEKFSTSRVFGWQEKVYSRSEIAAAQAAAVAAAQAAGLPLPPGAVTGVTGAPGMPPGMAPPGAPGAPGTDPNNPQQQQRVNKRMQAFGSSSNVLNKQLDPRTPGSILFTYVQTDEFCDSQELGRAVTTSPYEEENLLVSKLLSNPKGRAQVLTFRSMYVMADLGDEGDVSGANCKVLVSVRVYPDGSFDMCPGFSRPGFKYRFEDDHGGIFEYSVDNASAGDVPSLERRAAKLERAVVARAEELRRAALKSDFEPPPPGQCVRLLLLGDILAAADFPRDRLYVEYAVRWDPEAWDLVTAWPQQEPGIVQGVTHISRTTSYPADPARLLPARDVAHLNHPLELEWVSRGGPPPAANKLPAMFFQVCTLDKLNRYTSQGYGWLALADAGVPGAATHRVKTWRPLGTIRDKRNEFFVGGSAELNDLAYLTTPSGFNGRILNKYGFKTESVGALKVRLNTVAQRFNPDAEEGLGRGGRRSRSPSPGRVPLGPSAAAAKRNQKKDMSLKMVVERARQRLREARGDEVPDAAPGAAADVGVRPGLVAEAPTIVVHPQDAAVAEEGTVRFKVVARGLPPLKYEWYRDDRRLLAATADQPELILVQASLENEGAYYCQVSNKDGSVNSSKANLTVTRAARVSRATAGDAAAGEGSGRTPPRPPRNRGASVTSPGSSAGGAAIGGGRVGGARMSRLARLDAAAATPGTRGTSVDGGSEGGVSNTGASDLGAPGGGADLPPLPPPQQQQLAPLVTGAALVPASEAPLPPLPPPAMPPAPGAGAAEGFRKRPPRGPSGSGAAPLPPPAPAAGSEIEEMVQEVEEVVEAVPRPIARQGSAAGPAAAPAPAASGTAAAAPPKAAPKAAAAADDLEAEDIE